MNNDNVIIKKKKKDSVDESRTWVSVNNGFLENNQNFDFQIFEEREIPNSYFYEDCCVYVLFLIGI